jgi:hypothetical protein
VRMRVPQMQADEMSKATVLRTIVCFLFSRPSFLVLQNSFFSVSLSGRIVRTPHSPFPPFGSVRCFFFSPGPVRVPVL